MTVHVAHFADLDGRTLYELLRLRLDVFVVEQSCAYPELDGRDTEPTTQHVWTQDGAGPTSYLRVLRDHECDRIGRVCTRLDVRGRGLGAALLAHVLEHARRPVALEAQSHLVEWYARFGFIVAGSEYVEDGIPHVPMRRDYGNDATISSSGRRRPV